MKPSTPEQLARLLDQISSSYPHGIPREAIRHVPEPEGEIPDDRSGVRFHIFIVGSEAETSNAARELLGGITSKGLKISAAEFTTDYAPDESVESTALASSAQHVIVFGAARGNGWAERSMGKPVLFTSSLEALMADAALKKSLWRDLQSLL